MNPSAAIPLAPLDLTALRTKEQPTISGIGM